MASSQTDICNLALFKLGSDKTITSMVEKSKEAIVFNRIWDQSRSLVLSDGMWPWAMKAQKLALASADPEQGWQFRYSRPNDCLTAWAVTDVNGLRAARHFGGLGCFCDADNCAQLGLPAAEFEQVYGSAETEILTDLPEAYLIFTVDVTDTGRFPPFFVDALAARLAADGGPAIVSEFALRNKGTLLQEYLLSRSTALAHDLNEMRNTREPAPPSQRAREC